MHQRFADKIAKHLHLMKWKGGVKQAGLVKWLADRFPNLTPDDAKQIRDALPATFNGSK